MFFIREVISFRSWAVHMLCIIQITGGFAPSILTTAAGAGPPCGSSEGFVQTGCSMRQQSYHLEQERCPDVQPLLKMPPRAPRNVNIAGVNLLRPARTGFTILQQSYL